ncbi:MAG TPA: Nif3-like dinuclear metal center hexameric protein [Candidatus Sphingobacterium stercoripullorum]|uniref:GTP cyclohydrolase 1 type 2 homolog n=1 Tax=Candidatus Sphingobacterium stercoripullorum TaxID=2838759 RepID=A0A9D2AY88_9SPHI|nr:Nif3-like dinuclear metal center hexameric protein [Candidatus Sphingobacterium stercoripullorum]HLR49243.1 Nif3-like dinuclear metal center hexameric protein [Candidatus Sphingobacterium stercoripullorum]
MKLKNIVEYLEQVAPLAYQESYDNSGLLVGDPNQNIDKALVTLDCTEEVIQEAIANNCNLIIAHHPLIFKGLKKLTPENYISRALIKAIQNNVAIYAIHTNLDNVYGGVSSKIGEKLGLTETAILSQKRNILKQLVVYVPRSHVEQVREALFEAGAGAIGNYDQCSFNSAGYGTFRPGDQADPTIGTSGSQERVEETKIEVVFPADKERSIIVSMLAAHPYEEVAYHVLNLDNLHRYIGSGVIGNLPEEMTEEEFLLHLKESMHVKVIRHTKLFNKSIKRVAVCGGSGSFLLKDAIRSGADVYVSADFKYHEFFDAEDNIVIADIGHYESEQFTQELLIEIIREKFPNFAVLSTEIETNPIKYFI